MRPWPHLTDFRTDVADGYRSWRIQEVKCSGKTKHTMVTNWMLVGRRKGTTVGHIMKAELG
jgi:hypothetical protein